MPRPFRRRDDRCRNAGRKAAARATAQLLGVTAGHGRCDLDAALRRGRELRASARTERGTRCAPLYFFKGPGLRIGGRAFGSHVAARVRSDVPLRLEAAAGECEVLMLQGRPIGQPVVQYDRS